MRIKDFAKEGFTRREAHPYDGVPLCEADCYGNRVRAEYRLITGRQAGMQINLCSACKAKLEALGTK